MAWTVNRLPELIGWLCVLPRRAVSVDGRGGKESLAAFLRFQTSYFAHIIPSGSFYLAVSVRKSLYRI